MGYITLKVIKLHAKSSVQKYLFKRNQLNISKYKTERLKWGQYLLDFLLKRSYFNKKRFERVFRLS